MKNPFLAILIFAGVFICGGVVGGAVSIHYYEQFIRNKGADRFFDREIRELGQKLELTPQQWKETRTIFNRAMADQRAARKQGDLVLDRMVSDFEAVLTPEQLSKFKEFRAKRRASREQQLRERRGPQGPDGARIPPLLMEQRDRERPLGPPARPETPQPQPEAANLPAETKPAP
ncbi:MAG: hypothetical protein QM760_14410 [Nibricoccus sp.]